MQGPLCWVELISARLDLRWPVKVPFMRHDGIQQSVGNTQS